MVEFNEFKGSKVDPLSYLAFDPLSYCDNFLTGELYNVLFILYLVTLNFFVL